MGTRTDEVRQEIEQARQDLGETIDEVTERAKPRKIAERGGNRVRHRLRGARDTVMGSADQSTQRAEEQVKGNPLAAGLVAFGCGALVASLLPPTKPEQQAAQALAEKAKPVAEQARDEAQDVGKQLSEDVKHSGQEAAQRVGERAKEAGQQIREDAGSSAEQVRGQARHAAEDVQHEARRQT